MKNKYPIFFALCLLVFFSCRQRVDPPFQRQLTDLDIIKERGVLRVATLSRSTSFFVLRGKNLGYEYELADHFARSLGIKMEMVTALDVNDLVDKLCRKEIDLIAYPLPINNAFKEKIRYTEHKYVTNQVLIQAPKKEQPLLKDVTQLIGKEVYVVENSKYHERLKNLNEEIGGGILICTVSNKGDEEKLIEMVAEGKIFYTVADDNIARINQTYFDNIDVSLSVSFVQRSAWAVGLDAPELYNSVNRWFKRSKNNYLYQHLYHKYFELKKGDRSDKVALVYIDQHTISVFDDLFKQYAETIGWDWRLLASIAYQESKFDPHIESWAGAKGLMQLMPSTAHANDSIDVSDPQQNVKAAVAYIQSVTRSFNYIEDKDEKLKFILASYNAGVGHIKDAIELARKYNKDPEKWDDHVAECVLWKSVPDYFNDPVVKCGYLRGEEAYKFVREVLARYEKYKEVIKK